MFGSYCNNEESKGKNIGLRIYYTFLCAILVFFVVAIAFAIPDKPKNLSRDVQKLQSRVDTYREEITILKKDLKAAKDKVTSKWALPREVLVNYILEKNRKVFPALAEMIVDSTLVASKKYGIPAGVLIALMDVESDYNYQVVSEADAVGLTQVHIDTWVNTDNDKENLIKLGVLDSKDDLYDPHKNIMAGGYILSKYLNHAKDKQFENPVKYALTRYYGGNENSHYLKTCKALGEIYIYSTKISN